MRQVRLFQVIPYSGTVPSSKKSLIWKFNLYQPLVEMGHDVVLLEADIDSFFLHAENNRWLDDHRPALSRQLWETFDRHHRDRAFDVCFFYVGDGFIDPDIFSRIRACGVPILNFSCNNTHQFHLIEKTSMLVDFAVHSERDVRDRFLRLGATPVHMQMAANPNLYKPVDVPQEFELSFIGQRYADRGSIMSALVEDGIDAHAFGPKWCNGMGPIGNASWSEKSDKLQTIWQTRGSRYAANILFNALLERYRMRLEDRKLRGHVHGIVSDEEMVELFSKSKINLGVTSVFEGARAGGKVLNHVRLRDFEIPMCGGFYLTGITDEIKDYFEVGKEIECYSSLEELLDKVRFFLRNEDARTRIRRAGLLRSLRDHRWQNRFEKLFADIGL